MLNNKKHDTLVLLNILRTKSKISLARAEYGTEIPAQARLTDWFLTWREQTVQ